MPPAPQPFDPEKPSERWAAISHAYGMSIEPERLARIAPILDALAERTRAALDVDLTLVEPAGIFTPGRCKE